MLDDESYRREPVEQCIARELVTQQMADLQVDQEVEACKNQHKKVSRLENAWHGLLGGAKA